MKLCAIDEIPDGSARGFTVPGAGAARSVLVVRRAGDIYTYENRCPHTGVNLDWIPDQFMDLDGIHLQCATHGALFRVGDGYCVFGPCAGQGLTPIATRIRDGFIETADPEAPKFADQGLIRSKV